MILGYVSFKRFLDLYTLYVSSFSLFGSVAYLMVKEGGSICEMDGSGMAHSSRLTAGIRRVMWCFPENWGIISESVR